LGGVGSLELVLGASRDASKATTLDELAASTAHWARSATGCDPTHVSLSLPDSAGRLRLAWGGGTGATGEPGNAASRRKAFRTRNAVRMQEGDRVLAMFPLVSAGTTYGVLEIAAPAEAVDEGWPLLEALADQVSIAMSHLAERRRLRREMESLEGATSLGRQLVQARDPEEALKLATRFVAERLRLPAAAWMASANSGRMTLTSTGGMGAGKRAALQESMGMLPEWASSSSSHRDAMVRRFGDVLGTRRVGVIDAGDGLLLVAEAHDSFRPTLDAVGSLLAGTIPLLATTVRAQHLTEQLDMGIALTAHELRAPLVGVKAALEVVLQADAESAFSLAMLRRSLLALDEFVDMTDSLLLWAVGTRALDRQLVDVVKVVGRAVRTCELAWGAGRVTVSSPSRVMARIDHFQLRRAIENVLRNALACSGPDAGVTISVSERDGLVTVSVRDHGPGIPQEDWEAIFEPLNRGREISRSGSHGLGLFIARRVIDAHGGRIWVESDRTGTTFHLQVPIEEATARRTAS
jgi:signal transduction histidine kinase